jgi:GT2 family glycosyltransferase
VPQPADRVAVVLVDTNEGRFLERTLPLLREQTRRPDRVIVADNASTDGSPEWIARDFPEVELVPLGRNAGFAVANNVGVRHADDCDLVVLLNADAYPDRDWLAALVDAAARRPDCASFASRMMRATVPGELDGSGDVYHVSGFAWRRDHGRPLADAPHALEEAEVFSACGGAAMYRRDAYLGLGGFDESFFGYLEDTDIGFRLQLAGHRCLYVPASVVHHVGSATTGAESEYTVYHSQRNIVWLWAKGMPWPLALLYLPQHLLLNVLMAAYYVARGRGGAALRAKRDALLGLPRVLRERRELQRSRRIGVRDLRARMETGTAAYTTGLGRVRLRTGRRP